MQSSLSVIDINLQMATLKSEENLRLNIKIFYVLKIEFCIYKTCVTTDSNSAGHFRTLRAVLDIICDLLGQGIYNNILAYTSNDG
jgi:hypothetical protein